MAALPVGQGYTPAQWEAWFTTNSPGTFTGTYTYEGTQLQGKTTAQVYEVIYSYGLTKGVTDPDDAAATTASLIALDGVAAATGDAAVDAADATSQTATGIETTNFIPGLTDIANFFDDLGQSNTWIRVAKIIVGGVLLIVGAAHLTGANKVVDQAAKVAPMLAA